MTVKIGEVSISIVCTLLFVAFGIQAPTLAFAEDQSMKMSSASERALETLDIFWEKMRFFDQREDIDPGDYGEFRHEFELKVALACIAVHRTCDPDEVALYWVSYLNPRPDGTIEGKVIREERSGKMIGKRVQFAKDRIRDWSFSHHPAIGPIVIYGHFTTRLLLDEFKTDQYSQRYVRLLRPILSDSPLPPEKLYKE